MKVNVKLILLHLLFWVLYIIIWGIRDLAFAPTFFDTLDSNVIGSLVYALGTYLNLYVLVPNVLFKKQRVLYSFSIVVLTLVIAFVAAQCFALYYIPIHPDTSKFFASWQGIANCAAEFLVVYGLSTCLYFINEWYIKERKLRELEAQNLKSELALLKGQLNPHFLFNALNSVHVLIRKDPERARETLERFSDLLSHQIYEVNKEKVPLSEEVENLSNFVALQNIRFEDRAHITWQVKGKLEDKKVAPMLFLNFVENAFKYAEPTDSPRATIDILLTVDQDILTFSCVNSVASQPAVTGRLGVGIANVKRRLEILYPGRHKLEIEPGNDSYSVNLELDLRED